MDEQRDDPAVVAGRACDFTLCLWPGIKELLVLAGGAFSILLFLAGAAGAADPVATESLDRSGDAAVSRPAPWLAGWTLDDQVWNLTKAFADTTSRRVALVFFATWCAPCRQGIERLSARADELRAAGVRVVLVDYQEEAEKVRRFVGAAPSFPVVLDRFGVAEKSYLRTGDEPVRLPRTVLIGREDNVVEAIFGSEGEDYVDRILAGR
jgi:thiol-disulfide isomerase/thioredoxin